MTAPVDFCPHCEIAATIIRETRVVPLGKRQVQIEDEFYRCSNCNEEFYSMDQATLRDRRVVERVRGEDNLLAPNQIRSIRDGVGLTQRQFEMLLGVGEKTCVRWEHGRVCQNVATDRLIRLLAADPANIQRLAAINGVVLPGSCHGLVAHRIASAYTRALCSVESSPSGHPGTYQVVVIGGSQERIELDTAEHNALVLGAGGDVQLRSIDATQRNRVSSVFESLVAGGVQ